MTLPSFGWRSQPLEVRVRVVCLTDGMVALLVEDVTESRRVEAVRRDFVANVGHEIKTPVGALALLAEAAVEISEDDREQMLRFLTRIRHEAARLSRLVTELIDLSRVQGADARPDPAPVAVDDVLAEAVDRISLGGRGQADLGRHRRRSRRARSSAASRNSSRPSPTCWRTRSPTVPRPPRSRSPRAGRGDWWEISVTDQGIGIPPEDLDRVFERFYRVDPARSRETGGTGLGLAIVKHIVNNHGGHVRVWSSPGSGSTFTLELPSPTRATPMTRVLVVEDEDSFSDALSFLLRKEGFEVSIATTGPAALEEFDRAGADIVLLDLMLPGLSGLEVCRELRGAPTSPS